MTVPFQLAVFTDEISQDLDAVIQVAKDYSIKAIELRSLWDTPPQQLNKEQVAEYKTRLQGEGIQTCSISSPFFKCEIDEKAEIETHYDILRRCIDLAHELEAPYIRGFAFWRHGAPDEDDYKRIAERFEKPLAILEEMDGAMVLENEGSTFIGTGTEMKRILSLIDHPRLKSVWDAGNSLGCPQPEDPYPVGYEAQKPWMVHVHIKDCKCNEDGSTTWVRVGEGDVKLKTQLKALQDDGYSGRVALETHWRASELDESTLNRPGGAGFSKDSEFATRACLDVLQEWLKEM